MMTLTGLTFARAAITSLLNEHPETQLIFCAHEIRRSPGSVFLVIISYKWTHF